MNTELKDAYESYISKFIKNVCESENDRNSLMNLWRRISSSGIEEDVNNTYINGCAASVKSGARKGQICGAQTAAGSEFCKRHEKKAAAEDKPTCQFILKNGKYCKKLPKDNLSYCNLHAAAVLEEKNDDIDIDEAGEAAAVFYFKEDDLSDVSLYKKYKNGYVHIPTNFYLKLSKKSGGYKVYGMIDENNDLIYIDEEERILERISYN
jgi:hypothetical protein